eukprot:SAG22_NODE_2474_length_2533_cov_1.889071_1_plen_310_part_10
MDAVLHGRRRKVHVATATAAAVRIPKAESWTAAEKALLQRRLDQLHGSLRRRPLGWLTSEGTTLLCMPPTEVYDRLVSFLSTAGVVGGLVFSAVAGAALSPLDLNSPPAEDRGLAEAYNVLAAFTAVCQLCVVLYSTFTLYILVSTAHNSTATYRSLLHMTRWIGFLEYVTFVPAMGALGLIVLMAWLRCSEQWAFRLTVFTAVSFVGFQGAFCRMCVGAFPLNAWAWSAPASLGMVWLPCVGVRTAAKHHGSLLQAQAQAGVLAGLDEDSDGVIDDDDDDGTGTVQECSCEEEEDGRLAAWVTAALGGS